jgi:hypothetical protein
MQADASDYHEDCMISCAATLIVKIYSNLFELACQAIALKLLFFSNCTSQNNPYTGTHGLVKTWSPSLGFGHTNAKLSG